MSIYLWYLFHWQRKIYLIQMKWIFHRGGFASGEVYLGKSRLNLCRVFLEHTIFQPSSVVFSSCGATIFKVWVISPDTFSLVYILRVQGLLEDFGCFKMLLELFLVKTFYFYFYCKKIINIKTSPYILHDIL